MSNKTIKMPAALADAWLAALRSGKYTQASGALCQERDDERGKAGYCCLGVLQMVADGDVERGFDGGPASLPSFRWQDDHEVTFLLHGELGAHDGIVVAGRAPSPALPSLDCSANYANDSGDYDFRQIADAIEAALIRT